VNAAFARHKPNVPDFGISATKLLLQTSRGSDIDNAQGNSEFTVGNLREFASLDRNYSGQILSVRHEPTGRFNCHGLMFAARRTCIDDPEVVAKILHEDAYISVKPEEVLAGDLVAYLTRAGDIEHSGLVLEKGTISMPIPKVCSKWGPYKEVIHWANQCPYDSSQLAYFRVKTCTT
jgi:hypothetical protein